MNLEDLLQTLGTYYLIVEIRDNDTESQSKYNIIQFQQNKHKNPKM